MLFKRISSHQATLALPQAQYVTYQYDGQPIDLAIWTRADTSYITTVVFLGTVQVGKIPTWIAETCPAATAVVQGAPHWLAKDDGTDIPAFMHRFTEEAFDGVLSAYRTRKLRIIADSQAVPGVLRLLAARPAYAAKVHELVLLQPLGFNTAAFGDTAAERAAIFKKRVVQNLRYQLPSLLSDKRLMHNHRQLLRMVGYDNAKSNAQYSSGLTCDATPDLQTVSTAGMPVVIVCGNNDKLFPHSEVQSTLARSGLTTPVIIVPGVPHSPLATKLGMRLLDTAFDHLNAQSPR